MEEWKEYRLGDLCKSISETYKGNAKEVVLVNTSDVSEGKCLAHTKVPNRDLKGQFKKTFKKDDILYSEIRPANKRYAFIDFTPKDYIASTKLMVLRHNERILPKYLYYILQSKDMTNELQMLAESRSGTFPQITYDVLSREVVAIPNISTQYKILKILGSLDDKIALDRKINSNLEEQAKALFKSWFIDFEPFKDGKFVDSELGKIPEGWKVGRYDDIVSATVVGDWGKDKPIGNYVHEVTCIRGCDFQDIKNGLTGNAPSRFILEKNFKNKCFANNDILVEISGGTQTVSTGRVCPISQELISRYNGNVVCTNFCRVLRPIEEYSAFIYYSWLYKYNHKVMFGYENGTSGIKNFRLNDFLSMEPLIIPPKDKVAEFQKVIDTINAQMQTTGLESSKLVETRDSLLPRLMSGEIDVRL